MLLLWMNCPADRPALYLYPRVRVGWETQKALVYSSPEEDPPATLSDFPCVSSGSNRAESIAFVKAGVSLCKGRRMTLQTMAWQRFNQRFLKFLKRNLVLSRYFFIAFNIFKYFTYEREKKYFSAYSAYFTLTNILSY